MNNSLMKEIKSKPGVSMTEKVRLMATMGTHIRKAIDDMGDKRLLEITERDDRAHVLAKELHKTLEPAMRDQIRPEVVGDMLESQWNLLMKKRVKKAEKRLKKKK